MSNPFVDRDYFTRVLLLAAKTRNVMRRFFMTALNKKLKARNLTDFGMTPLNELNPKILFNVYENRKKFTFSMSDLLNVIKQGLIYNIDLHPCPKPLMNPYTRTFFKKETMYLIFLKIHESNLLMPLLFQQFVKTDFNLKKFKTQNLCALQDCAILATVDSMTDLAVSNELRDILSDIFLHKDHCMPSTIIPNAKLIPVKVMVKFKPWLHAYYVYRYSFNPFYKEKAYKSLLSDMINFMLENPKFGSKENHLIVTGFKTPIPRFRFDSL